MVRIRHAQQNRQFNSIHKVAILEFKEGYKKSFGVSCKAIKTQVVH